MSALLRARDAVNTGLIYAKNSGKVCAEDIADMRMLLRAIEEAMGVYEGPDDEPCPWVAMVRERVSTEGT
jgi:hypothetical protein